MAGVLDKYIAGSSTGQSAAASSGGVFGTVKIEGVLDKYIEKPSDPIYDQWKLEQQMQEKMRQWRAQKAAQEEEKGVFAQVPQAVEPKTKEELRTDRKAALADARKERRQARGNAALETLTEASNAAQNGASTNFEKALEGALPSFWKQWRESGEDFQEEKTAAWMPENQQAAPERYDPFVQNAGQAKAAWYDPEVVAKGEQTKGNPLHEDARKKLAGGGMGNVNAAMEEMRAIDALTEDQKAYINYVYGKYDKKLAGQLTETLLQNVMNTLNAADERQKAQNVITAVGGQVLAAPVYAAEMLGQAVENLAKGSNLPVAEYTPGSRMMSEQAARTQDLVDDAKTPVGEFLTQTGVGVGQNVLDMVLFGKAAPAVMAIQSMGSGGYEAAQNGATGWQQLGKGAQSAVTELVTEKISFGKLEDILNGVTPKTVKGIIAKIAAQMATEAGEETADEAISILYDWIAMGDKGDLAQVMKKYREENGNDGAGGYLALQILQRLGEAAAGGAISGGILGGGATVINAVQSRNAAETSEQAADLPQEAAEAAGGDEAQVKPEAAQGGVERGQENAQGHVADFSEPGANQAPAVKNAQKLQPYTTAQVENWKNSKSIVVSKGLEHVKEFVKKAIEGANIGKKLYFGTVSPQMAEKIKEKTGLDLTGYNVTLRADEVRKIFKDHGTEKTEMPRGQRPITADDFEKIQEIIENPDDIIYTGDRYQEKPVIHFVKTINGKTTVVSYVSSKHKDLTVQTMYSGIKKEGLATVAGEQAPANTPEAHDGTAHEQIIVPEKQKVNGESAKNVPNTGNVPTLEPQQPSRPENKRSAESRARDAARELHAGKAGKEKILQTIRQMDEANMTLEMRRVVAQNVAKELVKEGPYISREFWDSFAPLRDYLRKTEMHIDPQTLGEIKAMGLTVTGFNQKYGTRLTTKNVPGNSLDGNMAEWAALTNGLAQESEGNAFDALVHTLEVMRQGKAGELDKPGLEGAIDGTAEVLLKYADETMEPDELEALDKKDGEKQDLQSTASQVKPEEAETKGSGWEKFKNNRIAQAMQHKPEGAVARMDTADSVRKAEEEIAKAKERLEDLKENAAKGEIDLAESVAKGNLTLQQVSADLSKERVALMAEQLRLIKQWEEQGLKGRKKEIAVEQYKNSNKILDRSDDELFNGEGQQKARMVSTGALMRRTPMRALVKVFGDTGAASMAQDVLIRPTMENESAKIQAINRIFDKVRKLDVNKYESTMVQLVGEGLVPAWSETGTNPLWHNGQKMIKHLPDYAQDNPEILQLAKHLDRLDGKKVNKAVKALRELYEDYFAIVNDFRLAHGFPEIGYIPGYFPHFRGTMDGDQMNQALKAFGIEPMSNLPTGIAGLTANFKPKSRFVANFLKRKGPKTTYDAMAGFQMYTNAVMDMLYHTDDIMRLRYMESTVRERATPPDEKTKKTGLAKMVMEKAQDDAQREGMEKRLDSVRENEDLEKEYGGFVVWLREYANALAGKGSQFDRGVEGYGSRNLQNVLNKTMGRYSTALVVGNLKSALANVSIVPKMMTIMATEGKLTDPEKYASKALVAMVSGQMRDVWHKSEFLSGKEGVDPLVKKGKDIYAEKAQTVFDVIERFMSRFAFATKYQQQMDKMAGLDITPTERENAAVQAANDFAAQIMSRRDKAGATLYSRSRSPVIKMLNMYQNEIWNSFYQNIDDIPNALKAVEKAHGKERAKKALANVAAHYVVHCAILDGVCEAVLGFSIVPNPLEYLVELLMEFIDPDDEEEDEQSNMEAIVAVAADIAGHLPSVSAAMALAGYDSGRVPLPNVVDLGDDILGIKKAETWQGKAAAVIDVLAGIGQFTGFPTSGQLAKTAKGVLSITEGGVRSRTTGQMQTVYKSGDGERLRALAFGPSGTKGMQEYFENGYKAELTQKQTQAYDAAIGSDIPKKKALEYVKWSKDVKPDKDENGKTISHSRNIKFLEQAASIEGLTAEQQAILYQGALANDQAEEFAAMTQQVQDLGIDMETWLEFLKRYYQINGSGKKDKVKKLMAVLNIPPVWQKNLAKVVGYEL